MFACLFAGNDELILESITFLAESVGVQILDAYTRQALKVAEVASLADDEGFVARIPGFRGLLATGRTKREALGELQSALADWIALALKRGRGLPPVKPGKELVSAH